MPHVQWAGGISGDEFQQQRGFGAGRGAPVSRAAREDFPEFLEVGLGGHEQVEEAGVGYLGAFQQG